MKLKNSTHLAILLSLEPWHRESFTIEQIAEDLWTRWNEPHRDWHGIGHLQNLVEEWQSCQKEDNFPLLLAIVFHDAIYNSRRNDNELRSAELFEGYTNPNFEAKDTISLAIKDTQEGNAQSELSQTLIQMDRKILSSKNMRELLNWEKGIAREYQFHPWPEYAEGRCQFLIENNQPALANYVANYRPNIGIYAGSFNPFHIGHLNILKKAESLFDKVIVAIGINPEKQSSSVDERLEAVQKILPFHEVRGFSGLLPDLAEGIGQYANVTLVRGLRDGYDLQAEINQARFLEDLSPSLRVVWLPCDRGHQHVSSSAIRALQKFDPERAKTYLPKEP